MASTVQVDISIGELIDKITILRIKARRIADPTKQSNISHELLLLERARQHASLDEDRLPALEAALTSINERMWDLEDEIRVLIRRSDYGPAFIDATRSVHLANEERATVKRQINDLTGSGIIEEKSYADVTP